MTATRRLSTRFFVTSALALILAAPAVHAAGPPPLDRIVVVIMENKSYDQVRNQPFALSQQQQGASFTLYFGNLHPSQPNYIAFWAGSLLGVTNNNCPAPGYPLMAENLGHACEAAGISWRAYSENLAVVGSTACSYDGNATSGLYTRKHDPWTQFGNLNHSNERPYSDLATDIAANNLPRLVVIIPNNCHNTHNNTTLGCNIADGDAWLAANMPAVRAALGPKGILVLTWDEDDGGSSNRILTTIVGDPVIPGAVNNQIVNHFTLNRMICEAFGLTPMGNGASEPSINGIWQTTVPTRTTTFGRVKAIYR